MVFTNSFKPTKALELELEIIDLNQKIRDSKNDYELIDLRKELDKNKKLLMEEYEKTRKEYRKSHRENY